MNKVLIIFLICHLTTSCINDNKNQNDIGLDNTISKEKLDFLGITNVDKLSAASKRALKWSDQQLYNNDWYFEYNLFDLKGDLAFQEGVVQCEEIPVP